MGPPRRAAHAARRLHPGCVVAVWKLILIPPRAWQVTWKPAPAPKASTAVEMQVATHIQTCTPECIHTHKCIHTKTHTYTPTHTHFHSRACTHTQPPIQTHAHRSTHPPAHPPTHTNITLPPTCPPTHPPTHTKTDKLAQVASDVSDSDDIVGDIGLLEGDAWNLSSPDAIDDGIISMCCDDEIVADTPPRKRARPRRPVFRATLIVGMAGSRVGVLGGWFRNLKKPRNRL